MSISEKDAALTLKIKNEVKSFMPLISSTHLQAKASTEKEESPSQIMQARRQAKLFVGKLAAKKEYGTISELQDVNSQASKAVLEAADKLYPSAYAEEFALHVFYEANKHAELALSAFGGVRRKS